MKKSLIVTVSLFAVFVIFTILVRFVDVGETAEGIKVGLFGLNSNLLPSTASTAMDKISDVCLVLGFVSFAGVVGLGIYQLVTRKSLKDVDLSIYFYACVSALAVVLYFIFNKVVINYRPVLVDGKMEASYPSSHIFLTTFFMLGTSYVYSGVLKNKKIVYGAYALSGVFIILCTLGRILSMNHWLTDCVAGIILGLTCVSLLVTLTMSIKIKEVKE